MYFYVRNRLHVHQAKFTSKAVAFVNYAFFGGILLRILVLPEKPTGGKTEFHALPCRRCHQQQFFCNANYCEIG